MCVNGEVVVVVVRCSEKKKTTKKTWKNTMGHQKENTENQRIIGFKNKLFCCSKEQCFFKCVCVCVLCLRERERENKYLDVCQ